jgi:hypothetical protein
MSTVAILELFNLATLLVEKVIPLLSDALKSGEVSVEKQAELKAKVAELRAKLESGELGSHWDVPEREA